MTTRNNTIRLPVFTPLKISLDSRKDYSESVFLKIKSNGDIRKRLRLEDNKTYLVKCYIDSRVSAGKVVKILSEIQEKNADILIMGEKGEIALPAPSGHLEPLIVDHRIREAIILLKNDGSVQFMCFSTIPITEGASFVIEKEYSELIENIPTIVSLYSKQSFTHGVLTLEFTDADITFEELIEYIETIVREIGKNKYLVVKSICFVYIQKCGIYRAAIVIYKKNH